MSEEFGAHEEELIAECTSSFIFNIIFVADQSDEGGLDYPLEAPYAELEPLVEIMLKKQILAVADYEEEGEKGQELVPGKKAKAHLNELIQLSESYLNKSCEGLDALRQAYYLAMHEGRLELPNEGDASWVSKMLDIKFYRDLLPKETPKARTQDSQPKANRSKPELQLGPKPVAIQSSSPKAFREPEISAIDLSTSRPEERDWPPKTYLFKKPAFTWGAITILTQLLSRMGDNSFLFWSSIACAAMTVLYAYRKVIISPQEIRLISLTGSTTIAMEDIEESTLQEEDGNISSLNIVSRRGDSIKLSNWMDDLSGANHLLRRYKELE